MYVNTHIFFVNKKVINPSSLTIVGGFIPDIALMGIIGWDDLHKKEIIEKFQKFISRTQPRLKDFGEGIMYHYIVDEVTHKHYKNDIGYAYKTITPKLIKLVSQSFQIENGEVAKTKAHTIIELAVDSFVLEKNPEILKQVKKATIAIDKEAVANILSSFFELRKDKTRSALKSYFLLSTKYDTRDMEDCVKLCNDMNVLLFNKTVDKDRTRQLMLYSRKLVENSYQEFLNVLRRVRRKQYI